MTDAHPAHELIQTVLRRNQEDWDDVIAIFEAEYDGTDHTFDEWERVFREDLYDTYLTEETRIITYTEETIYIGLHGNDIMTVPRHPAKV